MKVREIQAFLEKFFPEARCSGNAELDIVRPARIEEATEGCVTFVANEKYLRHLSLTRASLVIIAQDVEPDPCETDRAVIQVRDPYTAFVFILEKFQAPRRIADPGVARTAIVGRNVTLGSNVTIGEYAVIGDGCSISDDVTIAPHVVLMDNVEVGSGSTLYPGVVCYNGVRIGERVTVHSGTVVGPDGFGFAPQADGSYIKIPQTGIVEIGDDVEIGANTTIDRATMGSTVVEQGAKVDNLVQIAHNCRIGSNTVIASQAGISGSVSIGQGCMIGGQAGFAGHLSVADRTHIAARAGISKSVTTPGQAMRGYPAQPMRAELRQEALIRNLGKMKAKIDELEKELKSLTRDA